MRAKTKQRLTIAGITLFFGLVALEAGSHYIMNVLLREARIFDASPDTSFRLKPGITGVHANREFTVEYRINDQGFRGRPVTLPKPEGAEHILLLGDSFAFGHGVEEDESVAVQLERRFAAAGEPNVRVINAGFMAGTAPDDAYAFLVSERGRRFEPDALVHLVFLKNDFRDMAGHVWDETDARGLPTKIHATEDFPNEVGARGEIPYYKKNPVLRRISSVQLFMRFYFAKFQLPERARRIQAFEDAAIAKNEGLPERFARVMSGIAAEARERGLPLVVGIIPTLEQVRGEPHPYYDRKRDALVALLEAERVSHVVFDAGVGQTNDMRYQLDRHWNAKGHAKAAELLYELLVKAAPSDNPTPPPHTTP